MCSRIVFVCGKNDVAVQELSTSIIIPPPMVTVPQTSTITGMWYCVDSWNVWQFKSDSSIQMNVIRLI